VAHDQAPELAPVTEAADAFDLHADGIMPPRTATRAAFRV
jgi:hypothetical protein